MESVSEVEKCSLIAGYRMIDCLPFCMYLGYIEPSFVIDTRTQVPIPMITVPMCAFQNSGTL